MFEELNWVCIVDRNYRVNSMRLDFVENMAKNLFYIFMEWNQITTLWKFVVDNRRRRYHTFGAILDAFHGRNSFLWHSVTDRFRFNQNSPSPFFPSANTRTLSPFSLITQLVEMNYQHGKSFLKRNRSIINKQVPRVPYPVHIMPAKLLFKFYL